MVSRVMYLGWALITEAMNVQKGQMEAWNVCSIFLQAVMRKRKWLQSPLGVSVFLTLCRHLGRIASCELLWVHLVSSFWLVEPLPSVAPFFQLLLWTLFCCVSSPTAAQMWFPRASLPLQLHLFTSPADRSTSLAQGQREEMIPAAKQLLCRENI